MGARLEDDYGRLARASRSVAVELLVYVAPELPQAFTFLAHRSPPDHLAPNSTRQLDGRLRVGLEVQPPGWLWRTQPFMAIEIRLGPSS